LTALADWMYIRHNSTQEIKRITANPITKEDTLSAFSRAFDFAFPNFDVNQDFTRFQNFGSRDGIEHNTTANVPHRMDVVNSNRIGVLGEMIFCGQTIYS